MPTLNPKTTAVKAYVLAVIIVGILVSPLPQLALAIALLAIQLYTTYKPLLPKINLIINIGTLILTPLIIEPLLGSNLAALPIIPVLYLIDQNLKENSRNQPAKSTKNTWTPTQTLTVLATTLICVLTASIILFDKPLIFATSFVVLYLAVIVAYSYRKISSKPLKETKTRRRILVGNTESTLVTLSSETKLPLKITILATQPWICVKPEIINIIQPYQTQVNITYTPPLAGPTKLKLQTSTIDPWGLMQINQTIEPVDLHIIPKAKYAQWLAKKYLEQTVAGTASMGAAPPPRAINTSKQGVEFYGSRLYQPGDRLKDVDWKHTIMLDELIVKEFAGALGTPTIIAADLTAKDEQSADKLIYNVIMAALTAATESLPSGLACFNQKEVITASAPTNPRETLKKALKTTQKTTINPQPNKIIHPPQIQKLKRTIKGLEQEETTLTEKLAEILQFEYEAIQTTAKGHPASEALRKCVEKTPAPASITVASVGNGDSEALTVALEKLKERGYNIVTL